MKFEKKNRVNGVISWILINNLKLTRKNKEAVTINLDENMIRICHHPSSIASSNGRRRGDGYVVVA